MYTSPTSRTPSQVPARLSPTAFVANTTQLRHGAARRRYARGDTVLLSSVMAGQPWAAQPYIKPRRCNCSVEGAYRVLRA